MSNTEAPVEGVVIGIDFGGQRIGVARINSMVKIGEPLKPIVGDDQEENIQLIISVVEDQDAVGVVVGLPRGLDGQETEQTEICRKFATELKNSIKYPVYMIDEAATSENAKDMIKQSKSPHSVDSMAAVIIAEDFINYKNKQELRL